MDSQKYIELLEKELKQKESALLAADNLFDVVYNMHSRPTTYAQVAKVLEDFRSCRHAG